ncbi:MAG: acyl carrier protein [Bryobacteraceae bacterium]
MLPDDDLAVAIRGLLSEKLLIEVASNDTDLLQAGILDSLALIELLVHLEARFSVKISLDDLEIEDLRSVESIARFISNQRSGRAPASEEGGRPAVAAVNR